MDPGRKIRYLRRKDDPSKFMSEADLYKAAEGLPERQGKTPAQWFDYYSKEHSDTYEPYDASAMSTFADMAKNAPKSVRGVIGGVLEAVGSPIKTAKAMTALVTGKDTVYDPARFGFFTDDTAPPAPTVFRGADVRRAFADAYRERYGSMDAIANTIRTDPAGVLSDVALVPTGAGVALKAAGTVGKAAAKVAGKAGATAAAGKVTSAASRASGAGRAALHAADVIDPATAVPLGVFHGASGLSRPIRQPVAKAIHDALFTSPGGLHTAEDIRAAQQIAWDEGIGPGPEGRAQISESVAKDAAARDQAVSDVMATGDPALMYISRSDVVEPNPALVAANPKLKPLSALWDKAAEGRQGDAFSAHSGYYEAANQYLGEKTGDRFGLDQTRRPVRSDISGNYENPHYAGEFDPVEFIGGASAPANPGDPALRLSVEDLNKQRKAANLRQSQFDAAQAGKMDEATSQAMRRQEANFLMNNNARDLLYMKLEGAGIQPPKVNGKQMTWRELGQRDRNLMNLESMIEAVQKNLETKGVMAHLSPYYWSSLATATYSSMGGPGGTPLANMVAVLAMAKTMAAIAPDSSSKLLRYIGGQAPSMPRPVWEAVKQATKTGTHFAQGGGRGQQLIERFLDKQIEKAPTVEEFVEKNPEAAAGAEPPSPY